MSRGRSIKTEHAGAKNGGGYWGKRKEAKKVSSRLRRENSKPEVRAAQSGYSEAVSEKKVNKHNGSER